MLAYRQGNSHRNYTYFVNMLYWWTVSVTPVPSSSLQEMYCILEFRSIEAPSAVVETASKFRELVCHLYYTWDFDWTSL